MILNLVSLKKKKTLFAVLYVTPLNQSTGMSACGQTVNIVVSSSSLKVIIDASIPLLKKKNNNCLYSIGLSSYPLPASLSFRTLIYHEVNLCGMSDQDFDLMHIFNYNKGSYDANRAKLNVNQIDHNSTISQIIKLINIWNSSR